MLQEAVQKASEYQDRFAETLAALKAEHEAREELVRKYSKMADYAEVSLLLFRLLWYYFLFFTRLV